jgi:hypothetical protein
VVDENGTILYHENIAVTAHGYYVEAKDLRVGDVFIGANGELTTLTETYREEFPNGITVYNFEVADSHNYFVIANVEAYENGVSVVLVHNAGNCSNMLGQSAEAMVNFKKNTTIIKIGGHNRIPDGLSSKYISEVKNVKYQHLSTQLKDSLAYAQKNGLKFRLITDVNTKLSKPLQDLIKEGKIIWIRMKFRDVVE